MEFTEEEKVFIISVLSNKLTYLERDYIHSQKRLGNIYSEDGSSRLDGSLYIQKHKIDLCIDIISKMK